MGELGDRSYAVAILVKGDDRSTRHRAACIDTVHDCICTAAYIDADACASVAAFAPLAMLTPMLLLMLILPLVLLLMPILLQVLILVRVD